MIVDFMLFMFSEVWEVVCVEISFGSFWGEEKFRMKCRVGVW